MKSFVSAIYFNTNSTSHEKICAGILVVSGGKVFFAKSEKKIKLASDLLKIDSDKALKNSLQLLQKKTDEFNTGTNEGKWFLDNYYTTEYFKYLNKYSNGIIQFMEPKPYSGTITQGEFKKLYELFVGENLHKEHHIHKVNVKHQFHQILKKDVYKKVDIEYTIPANKLPSVYVPVNVDLIGKNGHILTANAIDFNSSIDNLKHHLEEYTTLIFGIEKLGEKTTENKLVADVPSDKKSEQFEIYQSILKDKKNSPFSVIHLDDFSSIEKEIQKKNFSKFSELIKDE